MTVTLPGNLIASTNSIIWTETSKKSSGKMSKIVSILKSLNPILSVEHFIVWMRTAGLPNFRKLYGVIQDDLKSGTYTIKINNNYNVSSFTGHKYFVISTTNLLGGQNYFLAICYIIVGALCLMFGIIFFIAYMNRKNQSARNNAAPSERSHAN